MNKKKYQFTFAFLLILVPGIVLANPCNGESESKIVNVMDFGAVGDGITDDSSSINQSITCLQEKLNNGPRVATLYFPPGKYFVSRINPIIESGINVKNGLFWQGLTITGSTNEKTEILTSGTTTLLDIRLVNRTPITIKNLSLTTVSDLPTKSAVSLSAGGLYVPPYFMLLMKNVDIKSGRNISFFQKAISIRGVSRSRILNTRISGAAASLSDVNSTCVDAYDSYGPSILDSSCSMYYNVLTMDAVRTEGFSIGRSSFNRIEKLLPRNPRISTIDPGGFIYENNVNYNGSNPKGIEIHNKHYGQISDNVFNYSRFKKQFIDITLSGNNSRFIVEGNKFIGSSNVERIPIDLVDFTNKILIHSNEFFKVTSILRKASTTLDIFNFSI